MPFVLPDLPFDKSALAPRMSSETLDYHHGKHHKAYVDKANKAVAEKGLEDHGLVELIRKAKRDGDAGLFNNAAQIWNHSFFWQCLSPEGGKPSAALSRRIDDAFGSTEAMLAKLKAEAVGHFSNGWAWLVLEGDALKIISTHDADTPVAQADAKPLLAIDLWEHAYYIDYRNERPKYLEGVIDNIVNWQFVEQNLDGKGAVRADQEPVNVLA